MVVIIDLGFSTGHKALNYGYIELLTELTDVAVMNNGEYYNHLQPSSNLTLINVPFFTVKKSGRLINRAGAFINMQIAKNALKRMKDADAVIFFTYEMVSFSMLGSWFYNNYKTYLFEHNSLDELHNPVKLKLYNKFKNRVVHLVLEEAFQEYLIDIIEVLKKNVCVIHHFLRKQSDETKPIHNKNRKIVNLSRSSSEDWISNLVYEEQKNNFFKNNQIELILRSRRTQFDNGFLKIIKGDFSVAEYNRLLNDANIILCIQDNFIHRISGSYYDAISSEKKLIANDCPVIHYLAGNFPSIVKSFQTIEELKNILTEFDIFNPANDLEIAKIKERYSNKNIQNDWKTALNLKA